MKQSHVMQRSWKMLRPTDQKRKIRCSDGEEWEVEGDNWSNGSNNRNQANQFPSNNLRVWSGFCLLNHPNFDERRELIFHYLFFFSIFNKTTAVFSLRVFSPRESLENRSYN
ncbi:hypothetical protein WN944_029541 [Citrus x changshan-huyou]|uniref:Uncharacterized protein n=1 Tax=Citrus x changshan-huyou TaxID=2935761 RepID=A0AAP0LLG5_9ROSI